MHHWGDDDFSNQDFCDVGSAAYDIAEHCRKRFIQVRDYKEKYGTTRVYCHFGIRQFHNLVWPGHCASRYPLGFSKLGRKLRKYNWYEKLGGFMWRTDMKISRYTLQAVWIQRLIGKYQVKIYQQAYHNAINKYPHIAREILAGADYSELLTHLKPVSMMIKLLK